MNYRLMLFTCKVRCFDHVVCTFVHQGYFLNTDILRHYLSRWNGCMGPDGEPYQYFETPEQVAHNDGTCCIPFDAVRSGTLCYYGRQQHDYEVVE